MFPAALGALVLVATPAAAQPPEKPAPPAKVEKAEPTRITGLESAVLTLHGGGTPKLERVKTADGPRVRVTLGDATLEATRLQYRVGDQLITVVVKQDGLLDLKSEPAPGVVPVPATVPSGYVVPKPEK